MHAMADPTSPLTSSNGGSRKLLIGSLVVRRVSHRSVARVAFPVFAIVYAVGLGVASLIWNLAAVAGWSPGDDRPAGNTLFWWAVAGGLLGVPLAVLAVVAMGVLYNAVSGRLGGIEIAVISPRQARRRSRQL